MDLGAKSPGNLGKVSPKLRVHNCLPRGIGPPRERNWVFGVFPKQDLRKVVFRTPGTGHRHLLSVAARASPWYTRAGERPGAQRWHVAPTFAGLPQPQAGASAELSQRSGLLSLEVVCLSSSVQLFRKSFRSVVHSACRRCPAQLLGGYLAPPRGARRAPGLRTPTAGSRKRRGGCVGGMRQLPTAGSAAALRTRTGGYAAQVLPLRGDVSAEGYKSLARSLPRFC